MTEENQAMKWNAVIGRSLAILAMEKSGLKDANLDEKAAFLSGLGLQKEDIANVLRSTPESVRKALGKHKKKRSAKRKKDK